MFFQFQRLKVNFFPDSTNSDWRVVTCVDRFADLLKQFKELGEQKSEAASV